MIWAFFFLSLSFSFFFLVWLYSHGSSALLPLYYFLILNFFFLFFFLFLPNPSLAYVLQCVCMYWIGDFCPPRKIGTIPVYWEFHSGGEFRSKGTLTICFFLPAWRAIYVKNWCVRCAAPASALYAVFFPLRSTYTYINLSLYSTFFIFPTINVERDFYTHIAPLVLRLQN